MFLHQIVYGWKAPQTVCPNFLITYFDEIILLQLLAQVWNGTRVSTKI